MQPKTQQKPKHGASEGMRAGEEDEHQKAKDLQTASILSGRRTGMFPSLDPGFPGTSPNPPRFRVTPSPETPEETRESPHRPT